MTSTGALRQDGQFLKKKYFVDSIWYRKSAKFVSRCIW